MLYVKGILELAEQKIKTQSFSKVGEPATEVRAESVHKENLVILVV